MRIANALHVLCGVPYEFANIEMVGQTRVT